MATDPREQLAIFLREIKHDPDDDTPRLVLADWLQDQGDPRGELLALDVAAHRLAENDPRRAQLRLRTRLLMNQFVYRWVGPLIDLPLSFRVERGFLHLEGRATGLLTEEVRYLARQGAFDWVMSLKLTEVHGPELVSLAGSPLLDAVPCLDVSDNRLHPGGLDVLLQSPRLASLRKLNLHNNRLGPSSAEAIAAHPGLAGLRRLGLARNRLGDEGVRALARSPHLNSLTHLDVSGNRVTELGLAALRERFGEAVRWG